MVTRYDVIRNSNGRTDGFMTNDWQQKHVFVALVDFGQFLPVAKFVSVAFDDFGVGNKIYRDATNHPHFLSVDDDRQFV